MLNNIFGCIFIGLLVYILFLALFSNKLIEGLAVKKMKVKKQKFKSYDKDPIQMATKNEENIKQLRKEVDGIKELANKAKQLKVTVDDNSKNIDGLIKQQQSQVNAASKQAKAL
jgi:hypothetical protein